jgi:hypothetical protein
VRPSKERERGAGVRKATLKEAVLQEREREK